MRHVYAVRVLPRVLRIRRSGYHGKTGGSVASLAAKQPRTGRSGIEVITREGDVMHKYAAEFIGTFVAPCFGAALSGYVVFKARVTRQVVATA